MFGSEQTGFLRLNVNKRKIPHSFETRDFNNLFMASPLYKKVHV